MKSWVYLISFLILSFSTGPCCIEADEAHRNCIEKSSHDKDDQRGNEPCSPFLNGCCTGCAIQTSTEVSFSTYELVASHHMRSEPFLKSAYQNTDFKPPKV